LLFNRSKHNCNDLFVFFISFHCPQPFTAPPLPYCCSGVPVCDCFLVSKWIFQNHHRSLTKFHTGSQQPVACVIIDNSSYSAVKNNNTAYHAFGKYWMQARVLLNYRLKYCWPKVINCRLYVKQTNLNGKLRKKLGGQTVGQP